MISRCCGCYVCDSVQEQIGQVLAKLWALKSWLKLPSPSSDKYKKVFTFSGYGDGPVYNPLMGLVLLLLPFNGLFSRTTWVSRHQKGKNNLDFTGARDSEWQWHQLGRMQVCTSLQTDNHTSTPPLLMGLVM